jgi:hypothetical protein
VLTGQRRGLAEAVRWLDDGDRQLAIWWHEASGELTRGKPGRRITLRDEGTTDNQVLDSDFYRHYDPRDRGRSGVGLAIKFGSGTGNLVRAMRRGRARTRGTTASAGPPYAPPIRRPRRARADRTAACRPRPS